jgi:type VI secretion system secreted protein VgrG
MPHLPSGAAAVPLSTAPLRFAYHDGEPVRGAQYVAKLADGSTRSGTLDAEGYAQLDGLPVAVIDVTISADPRAYEKFKLPATPDDESNQWEGQV